MVEVGCRVDGKSLVDIAVQLVEKPFLLWNVTHNMYFVKAWLQLQLLPYIEQEIKTIVGMLHTEGVAELESVLLEAEYLKLAFVEITVEFAACAGIAALVQMTPYGRDGSNKLCPVCCRGKYSGRGRPSESRQTSRRAP